MTKITIMDVLREICDRGGTAKVDRGEPQHSPYYWAVAAIAPNGGVLTGVPLEPGNGGVHEATFRHFIFDLDNPKTWATVGETMPKRSPLAQR
ncbi:MAG: hypothetical protein QOG61_1934 [Candidatus Binataceae bacterium]|jgi:hypothetical protein|nr:hypothetical protein [Candidatus Binataceae bacterium]